MSALTGRCSCGAVRYSLLSQPMFVQCCHCTVCQRETGSAFVVNALIETERIEVEGVAPAPVTVPTPSGVALDIHRCPRCQVAMWSDYRRRPPLRFLRVGTLDRPHPIVPDVHIFVSTKVPWVELPAGTRVFDEYYDMQKEWPAESLARRRAILGDR